MTNKLIQEKWWKAMDRPLFDTGTLNKKTFAIKFWPEVTMHYESCNFGQSTLSRGNIVKIAKLILTYVFYVLYFFLTCSQSLKVRFDMII